MEIPVVENLTFFNCAEAASATTQKENNEKGDIPNSHIDSFQTDFSLARFIHQQFRFSVLDVWFTTKRMKGTKVSDSLISVFHSWGLNFFIRDLRVLREISPSETRKTNFSSPQVSAAFSRCLRGSLASLSPNKVKLRLFRRTPIAEHVGEIGSQYQMFSCRLCA